MIRWLVVPVVTVALVTLLGGILNGYRMIGRLAVLGVVSGLISALLAYPMARAFVAGEPRALIVMMGCSALGAASVAVYFLRQMKLTSFLAVRVTSSERRAALRHFLSMSGTLLLLGIATTGSLLLIRSLVSRELGMEGAGHFDVAWTLSMMYVALITQSFETYYMPTLSRITHANERQVLVNDVLRLVTILLVPAVTHVAVLKPVVVRLLYSSEFLPSLKMIRWMLVGDYLKVTSWVFSMMMLAYADMRTFIRVDSIFIVVFFVFGYVSVVIFGSLEGIGVGFALVYAGYLAFMLRYAAKHHDVSVDRQAGLRWLLGFAIVLGASVTTWSLTTLLIPAALGWSLVSVIFSASLLKVSERRWLFERLRHALGRD